LLEALVFLVPGALSQGAGEVLAGLSESTPNMLPVYRGGHRGPKSGPRRTPSLRQIQRGGQLVPNLVNMDVCHPDIDSLAYWDA
jgi:hypothetical protein